MFRLALFRRRPRLTLAAGAAFAALLSVAPAASGAPPPPLNPDVGGVKTEGGLQGRRVSSAAELNNLLRSEPPFTGRVIVPKDAKFNLNGLSSTDNPIPLRSGVQLVGERGFLGSRPLLYTTDKSERAVFAVQGNDVRVEGLHFRGPDPTADHAKRPTVYVHAIRVHEDAEKKEVGRRVVIADNEFEQWPGASVLATPHELQPNGRALGHDQPLKEWLKHPEWKYLSPGDPALPRVERNYFHHNVHDGGGYGVSVDGGAFVTIEGNVCDFNRHCVAAGGNAHSGYVARFNYVLQGGVKQDGYYNQHFDVHGDGVDNYGGWAGTYFVIDHNTIRGEQNYACAFHCFAARPAFMLRGRPAQVAFFTDNVAVHDDLDEAVLLKKKKLSTGIGENQKDFNFRASGNRFDTDYSTEIAGGDFDGDGRSDVFVANGTAWFYSRAGIRPWEYLTASGRRTGELAFADIDNDGVTDVLWRDGAGRIGYSRSGRLGFAPLTPTPVPITDLRFGDFDGDGRTDIFYTRNGQWNVWYGRTRAWTSTQTSSKPISELLFGEFDDARGTDVGGVNSDGWAYSSGSTMGWAKLNGKLTNSFAKAVAADFDGNGKSDIAIDEGSRWRYSRDGRSPLALLLPHNGGPGPPGPLKKMVIGRFHIPGPLTELVTFSGDRLAHWDAQGCCFNPVSSQNMR